MALKPGSINDFANSMAQAMDQAFHNQWQTAKGEPLPGAGEQDRQLLFAAIAQGLVQHLKQHANDAFQIEVQVSQTGDVLALSDNPAAIPVSGGGQIATGQADVRQRSGADNLIISKGTATRVEILSE